MAFFGNKRKDFSIQPPRQQVDDTPFFVTDSANIDFTLANLNLTANLTQLLPTSGTYGDATHIPVLQIDQWGRITGVTTIGIGGGGGTYTVNNGLSPDPLDVNNFQLGGTLIQNTNINTSTFYLELTGSITSPLFRVNKSGTGYAIDASNIGGVQAAIRGTGTSSPGVQGIATISNGVSGISTNSAGVSGSSTTGIGVSGNGVIGVAGQGTNNTGGYFVSTYTSNDNVQDVLYLTRGTSSSPSQIGIGSRTSYWLPASNSTNFISNQTVCKLTNVTAGSLVSDFEIWNRNGGLSRVFNLAGTGQLTLDKYLGTTFDGTAVKALGVDASGNVITTTVSDGGGILYAVATGTDAYLATISGVTTYVAGDIYSIKFTNANTGASTINISGSGVVSLKKSVTTNLASGDILADQILIIQYDGTNFQVIGIGGGGSGGITALTGDVAATGPGSVAATLKANLKIGSFGVTVDGVTSIVQVGKVGYVTIPYAGTITGWSITANAVGNIQFDIWKAAGAIPTTTIVSDSTYPALVADDFDTSTTVGGWNTTFAAGDVFGFQVIGTPSVIKNATLTIRCTKS